MARLGYSRPAHLVEVVRHRKAGIQYGTTHRLRLGLGLSRCIAVDCVGYRPSLAIESARLLPARLPQWVGYSHRDRTAGSRPRRRGLSLRRPRKKELCGGFLGAGRCGVRATTSFLLLPCRFFRHIRAYAPPGK